MRIKVLATVAVAALLSAPLALAASSPAVSSSAATGVTDTAATLNGRVNPEGEASTYTFAWGPTPSLGGYSPAAPASAGSGRTAVVESTALTGLTPGSTYYFQLRASNAAGSASTPIRTFKTGGSLPPGPTTGSATAVGRYQATLTGTIVPNGAATVYYFQYGLTSSYGLQTAPLTLPAGSASVPVSTVLAGLQPGATFHYRLVATHDMVISTYGADESFQTLPFPPPRTRLTANVSPRRELLAPYRFNIRGRIAIPTGTPATLACSGRVRILVMDGRARVGQARATVRPDCSYRAVVHVSRLPRHRGKLRHLRLSVQTQYMGDTYVARSLVVRRTVTVGRASDLR
ncbi:MAG: hypothetical protein ACRDKL_03170 [Solirubrobacteraceae bacterium]